MRNDALVVLTLSLRLVLVGLVGLGIAGCGSTSAVEAARTANRAAARKLVAEAAVTLVVGGKPAAEGDTAEAALEALDPADGDAPHRLFVIPADPGGRLLPLVFLPEGGSVAGAELIAALGVRRVARTGRPTRLLHGRRELAIADSGGKLTLELRPLDGGEWRRVDVPWLHDFPGALLLPQEDLADLDGARSEVAGHDEVQVALGRPFRTRRSLIRVRIPALGAEGVVIASTESAPTKR